MSLYTCVGVMCENLTTTVEGSVITNCQSGVSGYGRDGDTCVITYHNVMELWVCQESRQWTTMSSKTIVVIIIVLYYYRCCIIVYKIIFFNSFF